MSVVLDEPFDSLTGWTNTGTAVISSAQSFESGNSLLIDATGSAKHVAKSIAGGIRAYPTRFYYFIETDTSGSASIIQFSNASGVMLLQARPGRKIRPFMGSTAGTDSAALNLSQWYCIDILPNSSADPATITWAIDEVAQTGQSRVQAAADLTLIQIGNTASNTYKNYFDALKTANTAGEYPIGPIVVAGLAYPILGGGYYPA